MDTSLYSHSLVFSEAPAFWRYVSVQYSFGDNQTCPPTFHIASWLAVVKSRLFIPHALTLILP